MSPKIILRFSSAVFIFLMVSACTNTPSDKKSYSTYQQLVDLFVEWREFHAPEMIDGVPDYSDVAMKKQFTDLKSWQQRLNAFDTTGWPIKDQVDWYLVWAEMNGLDFEHRVTKPWVRDPAFYVWFYPYPSDVPEREGPNMYGAIELPRFGWPLSKDDAVEIAGRLRNINAVYEQAKKNLSGNAKDLWVTGKRTLDEQGDELESFANSVEADHPDLADAAREAKEVSDEFAKWVDEQASSKSGLSGVGKENYSWNLKNVHLIPYTWEEEKILMERELARSHSALRMSEHNNSDLPKLSRASTPEEYDKLINDGVDEFLQFLEEEEVLTMEEYMEPALRAQVGKFVPS
ncbi:MAG: DUF885 domain-containing protein, partial [Flammeovirgaceae bacterium]|nr:DUF885 domain-containing protein [Flammeovirgaceae bacterium]